MYRFGTDPFLLIWFGTDLEPIHFFLSDSVPISDRAYRYQQQNVPDKSVPIELLSTLEVNHTFRPFRLFLTREGSAQASRRALLLCAYSVGNWEGEAVEDHLEDISLSEWLEVGVCLEGVDLLEEVGSKCKHHNEEYFPDMLIFLRWGRVFKREISDEI